MSPLILVLNNIIRRRRSNLGCERDLECDCSILHGFFLRFFTYIVIYGWFVLLVLLNFFLIWDYNMILELDCWFLLQFFFWRHINLTWENGFFIFHIMSLLAEILSEIVSCWGYHKGGIHLPKLMVFFFLTSKFWMFFMMLLAFVISTSC